MKKSPLTFEVALNELEQMEPVFIKNELIGLLLWQQQKGRRFVSVVWYLMKLIYTWKTREERRLNARLTHHGSPTAIGRIIHLEDLPRASSSPPEVRHAS